MRKAPPVIEIGDEGVGGKGRASLLGGVERQIAHQYIAQQWVADQRVEHRIDAPHLVFGQDAKIRGPGLQGMQRRGPGDASDQVEIVVQPAAFGGETCRQLLDEGFAPLRQPEMLASERDHLVARGVEAAQPKVVEHLEVAQQPPEHLPLVAAADEVHAGLELRVAPAEALQASADPGILLQNSHVVSVPGQDNPARQPPEAATYDDTALFHRTGTIVTQASVSSAAATGRPSSSR